MSLRRTLYISLAVNLVLAAGLTVVALTGKSSDTAAPTSDDLPYLSRRIFTEDQNDLLINFVGLRSILREYTDPLDSKVGLYFEYLPTGTSIGIGNEEEYPQASLVKVPVVIAVYKQVAAGNLSFDQKLTLQQENLDKEFGDLWKKGAGHQVTVRDAVRLALVESDNTATRVLIGAMPDGTVDQVFDALDIPKDSRNNSPLITPKAYMSIFRSLYLASYVDKQASNEILDLLSQSNFKTQLPAGVVGSVPIAHKIGVSESDSGDLKQNFYSDCGIIYVPMRPYMLCVMTKNMSKDEATQHIKNISKLSYEYVTLVD